MAHRAAITWSMRCSWIGCKPRKTGWGKKFQETFKCSRLHLTVCKMFFNIRSIEILTRPEIFGTFISFPNSALMLFCVWASGYKTRPTQRCATQCLNPHSAVQWQLTLRCVSLSSVCCWFFLLFSFHSPLISHISRPTRPSRNSIYRVAFIVYTMSDHASVCLCLPWSSGAFKSPGWEEERKQTKKTPKILT